LQVSATTNGPANTHQYIIPVSPVAITVTARHVAANTLNASAHHTLTIPFLILHEPTQYVLVHVEGGHLNHRCLSPGIR